MSSRQWTPEQRAAIQTVGQSLLVSAAAGSGKTSVLAERCVYLICDAPERCGVSELLVVTFTEAAAAEMKKRITDRLVDRVEKSTDTESRRLRGELMLIEQANISTLHSFCLRLIRQHFYRLELDPAARIIDQDESALLRSETVKSVFARLYETGDDTFANLLESYGDGRDENLMDLVIRTHALMESLVDPQPWRAQAAQRIADGANLPFDQSEIGRAYLKLIKEELAGLLHMVQQTAAQLSEQFSGYKSHLGEIAQELQTWQEKLSQGYDALAHTVENFQFRKAPAYPKDFPGKDEAKAAVDRVKKSVQDIRDLLIFTSDQWRDGLRAILPHVQMFLSLVEEFGQTYAQRKRQINGLDFADLERFALQLLQMPEVSALCQKQFKHILVDEYQDINSVQEAILAAVGCGNNHFYVGDVKQSIYRFRLAEPAKFLEKTHAFGQGTGGTRIDLNCNFRSRAALLEAINGVFACLMTRDAAEIEYDSTHRLNAGAAYPDAGDSGLAGIPIGLHLLEKQDKGESTDDELDRTEREALLVARQIAEMVGHRAICHKTSAGWESRLLRCGDIAILLRATTHKSDYFAEALRQQNIPVYTEKGVGFFEAMEIRDMLALLNLLDNQQQDVPLASVLRSPLGGFDTETLAQIRLAFPDAPFHQSVRLYAEQHTDSLADCLKQFFAKISQWRDLAQRRPLAEVVWHIYTQTAYLTYCAGLPDGAQKQANLLHFHERCKQFGRFGEGLHRFLKFIDELQKEQESARPAISEVDENAVKILSIHSAKGLEFPVVFVPDLGKQHNTADLRGSVLVHREGFLGLATPDHSRQVRYPSIPQILIRRQKHREMLAEELRLLYVAMTRAKEHLVLIGTAELSSIEQWTKWAAHSAVMPAEQFLAGRCMLDWLGPAAMRVNHDVPGTFAIQSHTLVDIAQWQQGEAERQQLTARQMQFAELKPIESSADEKAERIISKLQFTYPQQGLTKIAAARSVSQVSKNGVPIPVITDEEQDEQHRWNSSTLKLPRWLRASTPEGTEVGSATHRVLQYVDFARLSNLESLEKQIDSLIGRRLLLAEEKSAVRTDAILWLMQSELGELLRNSREKMMRELPVFFRCEPGVFDASITAAANEDGVMLRGRLDAAIETADGLILLDYKTDNISGEEIAQRGVAYERQINWYKQALERMGGKKVAGAYLIFLTPRVIRKVS
ncbi:MAG TPA: helicase-exonuclease AddAB subunit AddA [Tepidisphaeraceae bacterium]|jgi:ATP-dependent helicase/nuclease subunit A